MVKKFFSITFILSSLVIGALAFPLYAGTIEPNMLYGFQGDVPLTDSEWIVQNKIIGAGAFAFACILISYHIFALRRIESFATSTYVVRGLIAAVVSIIPAYLVMLITESIL